MKSYSNDFVPSQDNHKVQMDYEVPYHTLHNTSNTVN